MFKAGETMIKTYDLCKYYGDITAVDTVNLSIEEGEIFGFLGPNGAGKTTVVSMLSTLLHPSSGTATVNGFDILTNPLKVRQNIAVVSQRIRLDFDLTVKENLKFYAGLYKMNNFYERFNRIVEDFDLVPFISRKVSTLSRGLMRKVEIARCFLSEPRVLFLDEPTAGLDPKARKKFLEKIRSTVKTKGITVFITTHILTEAETLCDRIGLLDNGKIVLMGTVDDLMDTVTEKIVEVTLRSPSPGMSKMYEDELFFEYHSTYMFEHHTSLLDDIRQFCHSKEIHIEKLELRHTNLEDVFIKYTGRTL